MIGITEELAAKRLAAIGRMRRCDGVLVALSGGVDSAVLLALAIEALGREAVLAVTGASESLSAGDLEDACRVARQLGARHEVLKTSELERSGYRANAGDRCYHCRAELFETLQKLAGSRGIPFIVYGAITDDLGDFRPGMRAAGEAGVLAPLLDAGMSKEDVRALARQAGLVVRDKPAGACLASRIPVGEPVTAEALLQVGRAEDALRELGFHQFRVRHHGEIARIELDPAGLARMADSRLRARLSQAVRAAGFRFVAVDLDGYRTGSLNPTETGSLYRIEPESPEDQ